MNAVRKAVWCWNDKRVISSADEVKRQAEKLVREGFEYVFPITNYLETIPELRPYAGRDPLQELIDALQGTNVKIHPWVTVAVRDENGPLLRNRDDLKARFNDNGTPRIIANFALCTAQPEVQAFKLELCRRLMTEYKVDGIHIDFIRWFDSGDPTRTSKKGQAESINFCVCDYCRRQIRDRWGEELLDITRRPGTPVWREWLRWRCDIVTGFVEKLHTQCQTTGHRISAAVFTGYPRWPLLVGQDWKLWVDRGWLDMVCTMDYQTDPDIIRNAAVGQVRICAAKAKLWVGVNNTLHGIGNPFSSDQLVELLKPAIEECADGIVLLQWETLTDTDFQAIRGLKSALA